MKARRHGVLFGVVLAVAGASLHCPPPPEAKDTLYEPVPLAAHDVKVAADADGDAKSPAHVSVFLQRGILSMKGGGGHTLEGVATGATGDAPPRLELMVDRVALSQAAVGTTESSGDGKFTLALGDTPMSLEVDTRAGEAQAIDLGGVALAKGRFYTEKGHLTIDWSAPNALPGGKLAFVTSGGYVEVTHVARSGAAAIDATAAAGLVRLDFGGVAEGAPYPAIPVTASVNGGTFVLTVPKGVAAQATVDAPPGSVVLKGFRAGDAPGTFVSGPPGAPARVTARVRADAGRVELGAN